MLLFFSKIIYRLFTVLYPWGFYVVGFFSAKAAQGWAGRKNTRSFLDAYTKTKKTIWFHVASLGEFEQARPLIEKIKNNDNTIIVTFFSPSGYEVRKNFAQADVVLYLPFDSSSSARYFIKKIQPDMVYWVKYDFWYYYLQELKNKEVPIYLVCANFREDQLFFRWYGVLFKSMLECYSTIFVQNKKSQSLLHSISIPAEIAPDTRFDRVAAIAQNASPLAVVADFLGNKKALVIGSSWEQDILLFSDKDFLKKILETHKIIVAPHNVTDSSLANIKKQFQQLSIATYHQPNPAASLLIIDTVGLLASCYRYADIAYIGGGFGVSVHNVLEAAVYGIPVLFGPNYTKAQEAIDLVQQDSAFVVKNASELVSVWNNLADKSRYNTVCEKNKNYCTSHTGGTMKILNHTLHIS